MSWEKSQNDVTEKINDEKIKKTNDNACFYCQNSYARGNFDTGG